MRSAFFYPRITLIERIMGWVEKGQSLKIGVGAGDASGILFDHELHELRLGRRGCRVQEMRSAFFYPRITLIERIMGWVEKGQSLKMGVGAGDASGILSIRELRQLRELNRLMARGRKLPLDSASKYAILILRPNGPKWEKVC